MASLAERPTAALKNTSSGEFERCQATSFKDNVLHTGILVANRGMRSRNGSPESAEESSEDC